MKEYQREFGLFVKKLRKEKRLTQDKLAELSDLTPAYLSSVERGIANPRLDTLRKIANGLGIPMPDLFLFNVCMVESKTVRECLLEMVQNADDESLNKFCGTLVKALVKK